MPGYRLHPEGTGEEGFLFEAMMASVSGVVLLADDVGDLKCVCPSVDAVFGHSAEETRCEASDDIVRRVMHAPCRDSEGVVVSAGEDVMRGGLTHEPVEPGGPEVRENEERYRRIVDMASEGIWEMDDRWITTFVNPRMADMLGYTVEEMVGKGGDSLVFPEDIEIRRSRMASRRQGLDEQYEGRFRHRDGSAVWTAVSAKALKDDDGAFAGSFAMLTDITAEIRFEERLRQSQKVEAMGTLAGGVAHDFNNILYAINGYAELLRDDLARTHSESVSYVEEILECSERASGLVGQILSFTGKAPSVRRAVRLGPIVEEAAKMVRSAIPGVIDIKVDVPDEGDVVVGNASQLHQVVMNLGTNAWQAMAETGGTLSLSVAPVELTAASEGAFSVLPPGAYVRLTVTDTGVGIPPDVIDRVFDPFFSTKGVGKGTGLGLSVVQGVVRDHVGTVAVDSAVGEGTTFDILLPRAQDEVEEHDLTRADDDLPGGTERLLVVDDDEAVLRASSLLLMSLGYHVTVRRGSAEALEVLLEEPDAIDLVIADLTMPGLTGTQLAEDILEIRPDMRMILCTGYGRGATGCRARNRGFSEILTKPIPRKELAAAVRRALDLPTKSIGRNRWPEC